MADNYSVRINRRDGAVEVSGDKEWVDEKLRELSDVYAEVPGGETGDGDHEETPRRRTGNRKPAKKSKAAPAKQPRRAKRGRPQRDAALADRLTSDVRKKLQEYVDARRTAYDKGATNQAAILAGFLRVELNVDEIDEDALYTLYSVMGWPTPNLNSALRNAYSRDKYFGGVADGKRELTQKGENFAYHGSLDA